MDRSRTAAAQPYGYLAYAGFFPLGRCAGSTPIRRAGHCPDTPFAPCPLPPAQNVVSVAIEAGDQPPVFRG